MPKICGPGNLSPLPRRGENSRRLVTTPHPYREGASTVLHRCCVAPQPLRWFRSTRQRWNALLPPIERAPHPSTLVLLPVGTIYHGTGKHDVVGKVHTDSM